ncbi:MAG: hypothetical protein WAV73_05060 [Candidatus Moraniibacteriota bacterium]
MNSVKRLFIVVFIATAFVAGFFSNAVASDFTNKSDLKAAIKSLERDMADLEQSKILLGLQRKILKAIRDNEKIRSQLDLLDREMQEGHEQLGIPARDRSKDVWNESYLREIATIEKEEEKIRRDEVKGSKLLRELKELLRRLESLEKKK